MSKAVLNLLTIIPRYTKRSGLRSMQNIPAGAEREIIEAYRSELTHDIWGDSKKLNEWAVNKFNEIRDKNYVSAKLTADTVEHDRNEVVRVWSDLITNNRYCQNNPFLKLKILRSIVSDLKPDNLQLPPVINLNVLEDAIYQVKKLGSSFKKTYFKLYQQFNSLNGLKTDTMSVNGVSGTWYSVKLPDNATAARQPGIFNKTKELISILSQRSNWCTRNTKALSSDFMGKDFHIFIDNKGYPQLCTVGSDKNGGMFKYIRGKDQYAKINDKYKGILNEFLKIKKLDNAVFGETDAELRPVMDILK